MNSSDFIPPEKILSSDLDDFDLSFKVFHELMAKKVTDILLVSSPYDAFIMEEEGRLAERIIHEYRGLNLSRPPKLIWASSAQEAFDLLSGHAFDLVITMPHLAGMELLEFCTALKRLHPDLPIFLLLNTSARLIMESRYSEIEVIDKVWVWTGNADLLLAIIKNMEDRWNVTYDTQRAKVRVIILVEDSPIYYSSLLPLLYKEIVMQTQAVMEDSLNDEHRILRMRARPKILLAENYGDAENLYRRFKPYLLSVLSDVRFPKDGKMNGDAGFELLSMIRRESPDIPLLNLSSEEENRKRAAQIPAVFLNKNTPSLHTEIRAFFVGQLGFGDFVFRMPEGEEIARASNLKELEKILPEIPDDSIRYHSIRNDFSTWFMARSEVMLASKLKPLKTSDFESIGEIKSFLKSCIHARRKGRQKGIVTDFIRDTFDPDADFIKIGKGSLGGKARGLAFFSQQLKKSKSLQDKFSHISVSVPKTLVISTEGFDSFMSANHLDPLYDSPPSDVEIKKSFLSAQMPDWLKDDLLLFLRNVTYPLAVRSSSLLEDAQFQPFAGIYKTYMLPNDHPDPLVRLEQLLSAVKLVYASTFLETPRSYAKSTLHRIEEEKMAVVIQEMVGDIYGSHFFPALSGVAQSHNYYPIAPVKAQDGVALIALGLGRTVVDGGTALRFSPRHPQYLPQLSSVEDQLKNAQNYYYALQMGRFPENFGMGAKNDSDTLIKLDVDSLCTESCPMPFSALFSTYVPEEHRIRDSVQLPGYRVLTFSGILKYDAFPLMHILTEILDLGKEGMGCPVEIEFAVHLPSDARQTPIFSLLQIRPMALPHESFDIAISDPEIRRAFCHSAMALGNGKNESIRDIVVVKPEAFDPAQTVYIAQEIGRLNHRLTKEGRPYLLIGPGRWGSADRWLGIPVTWKEISGVAAIVEAAIEKLSPDPSQGSHFFHNITSLGIPYITVSHGNAGRIDWRWLQERRTESETDFLKHIRLDAPITIKVNGKKSQAVILPPEGAAER